MANVKIYKGLPHIFELALACRFIDSKFFYLQTVDQGHGVQFSQVHRSIANAKIYKCHQQIFALALTVSYFFLIFDLQKVGQGNGVQFSQFNYIIRWQMSKSTNVSHKFVLALTVSGT